MSSLLQTLRQAWRRQAASLWPTPPLMRCFFASDLHGHVDRYETLFASIAAERPRAVFLGGDLLPNPWIAASAADPKHVDFVNGFLRQRLAGLKQALGTEYPRVFVILGNDDGRVEEASIHSVAAEGLWEYAHDQVLSLDQWAVIGYSFIPPSPFQLKDWEKYDVSRYVDPGCVSPEEGARSSPVPEEQVRLATMAKDLEELAGDRPLDSAILLFHCPPYQTLLDRADLDGQTIDHVPLDVNIGSVAIRRFIEDRQPLLGLFGHVHESARLTGSWRDSLGATALFSAAHDGPELALVDFDPRSLESARRRLL